MITFDAVTKAFPGGNVAVDNLSLELATGEITVFVGPSGCGKTTSLRMINRTIEPTSGVISIDGEDVTKQDAALLRRGSATSSSTPACSRTAPSPTTSRPSRCSTA